MVNEGSSALFQADKHFTFRTEALVHLSDPVRHMTSNVGYGYEADILSLGKAHRMAEGFQLSIYLQTAAEAKRFVLFMRRRGAFSGLRV
jgi:hypothetical protein